MHSGTYIAWRMTIPGIQPFSRSARGHDFSYRHRPFSTLRLFRRDLMQQLFFLTVDLRFCLFFPVAALGPAFGVTRPCAHLELAFPATGD